MSRSDLSGRMLSRLTAHIRELVRRRRAGGEADEEFRFHIEMETEANCRRGMTADEARRAAMREFGGVAQAREGVRAVRTTWLDGLWQDISYSLRLWRRQPALTATALLTLGLGIGTTTAIASAAYGVLLRPLPVRDERALFMGYATRTGMGDRVSFSWPAFEAWRDSGVLDEVAAVATSRAELTDGVAERISIQKVTGNFFHVIGAEAAVGRVFSDADETSADTPAVISDTLWRSRFAGASNIVGKQLQAGRLSVTIIGVLQPRVDRWRASPVQMWVPIDKTISPRELTVGYSLFTPVARLAPERVSTAIGVLNALTAKIDGARVTGVRLIALREDVSSPHLQRMLLVMFAGASLTWLVVCANLSNLLLARGPARAGELTVRLAIGATRARIVRQLLCESGVLALIGGVAGVWLAFASIRAMSAAGSIGALNSADLELSPPILGFALLITLASAVLSGLVPALTAGRVSLSRGSASLEVGRASRRWSRALVMTEIAVSVIVMVSAALLVKSIVHIANVPLGFDPQNVLVFQVSLPSATYGSATTSSDDLYLEPQRDLLSRLSTLPGVEKASLGSPIFQPGAWGRTSLSFEGGRRVLNGEPKDQPFAPGATFVGPDYFAVHGVSIVRGREFAVADDFSSGRVVVVNEAMAALHWPNQDPIGRRVNFGSVSRPTQTYTEPWAEVIGVVANVRHEGIDLPVRPFIYRAVLQYPRQEFQVMLRTSIVPGSLASAARATVQAFDPGLPMFATRALRDVVDDASADVRHMSVLLMTLAGLTVLLAGVGVFSVLVCVVAARGRELAIRVALGARPAALVGAVLRHAALMIGPGVLAGVAGASAAAGSLSALLFEVEPTDPTVFVGATTVVVVVAVAAAYVPARRAARIDPVRAVKA